uniref:ribonuclease H n=1 Tax=Xenopus tropicalis TaxID=8364 RepID=A0A803JSY7_XENTR
MAAATAVLRNKGISITPYPDDLLIKASSPVEAQRSLQSSMTTLQDLGWCINLAKSSLVPSQSMVFLGMQFDSQAQRVSLPHSKALHLQSLVRSLLSKPLHTVRFYMRVLGVMVSTIEAVPFAQCYLRELQRNILSAWKQKSLHMEISLTHQARVSLSWWLQVDHLVAGKPLGEPSQNNAKMGHARGGSYGDKAKPKGAKLLRQVPGPPGVGGRRSNIPLGFSPRLRFSSSSSPPQDHKKAPDGAHYTHPHSAQVASLHLVFRPRRPIGGGALDPTSAAGPSISRPNTAPKPSQPQLDGVALETRILKQKGLSDAVVHTMRAPRKPVSARTYHRVWATYQGWCNQNDADFETLSDPHILEFLQNGLSMGLSLGSQGQSQVSALSILFQQRLALLPDVKTFLQGVAHVAPPFRTPSPTWDLIAVLQALQRPPFEPLASIPLQWLTWKTVFLLAIASARRVSELSALSCKAPFLVFHHDRAVLRTVPPFLPKVVSTFHLNQEITVPTFCPTPSNPKEVALHSLDPVRALKFYLHRVHEFRKSDSLFVLFSGPGQGAPATKATISRWIKQAIQRAYSAQGQTPPLGIKAHSTRGMSTSWAFRNQASAEQLCKAATWTSVHSFIKFYQFDTFGADDTRFGRKVLQAAVEAHT